MTVVIDSTLMRARFRGCLLGSLLGDCLGVPFEGSCYSPRIITTAQDYIDNLERFDYIGPKKRYSDDTAMTNSVLKSLIEKPLDFKYMAKHFVEDYFRDPKRGYGGGVVKIFRELKRRNYQDHFQPSFEQFGGFGSYGNGGAIRIPPIALHFHDNYDAMIEAAINTTKITHSHKQGINGALLQCLAVHQSLLLKYEEENQLDIQKFVNDLIEKIKVFDNKSQNIYGEANDTDTSEYETQLLIMKEILSCESLGNPFSIEEITSALGNDVSALYSVPTAIYCFLKAQSTMAEVKTEDRIRRAIQYAICLGGDTDTIAAMTGAISGAYFGQFMINPNILNHCEYCKETVDLADQLFNSKSTAITN